jgi:hypothetical protein
LTLWLARALFKLPAGFVYKPFLESWHAFDFRSELEAFGMRLETDEVSMPFRRFVASKI